MDSSFCGIQYRRITEVIEDDEEISLIGSSNAERSKTNSKGRRLFSGPETPAEADPADEDITEFKSIQIVAPPNVTGPVEIAGIDESAGIWSAFRQQAVSSEANARDENTHLPWSVSRSNTVEPDDDMPEVDKVAPPSRLRTVEEIKDESFMGPPTRGFVDQYPVILEIQSRERGRSREGYYDADDADDEEDGDDPHEMGGREGRPGSPSSSMSF